VAPPLTTSTDSCATTVADPDDTSTELPPITLTEPLDIEAETPADTSKDPPADTVTLSDDALRDFAAAMSMTFDDDTRAELESSTTSLPSLIT
jgi:hypothetical protein